MKTTTALIALIVSLFCASLHAQDAPALVIPTLPTPSQLEKDQAALLKRVEVTCEALNNVASQMANEHAKTWGLPDDRLLALLNADVTFTKQMQSLNDYLAGIVNAYLEGAKKLGVDRYTARAPIGLGREDVKFDEAANAFVIIPKEEPPAPTP